MGEYSHFDSGFFLLQGAPCLLTNNKEATEKTMNCISATIRNTSLRSFRTCMTSLLTALMITATCFAGSAHAYATYEGGDWGGRDFTPMSGDVLSGTFTNIGRFIINPGDTIYAKSGALSLFATEAIINGTLKGGVDASPSLTIVSSNSINLNGMLSEWSSIALDSNQIFLLSGSSIVTKQTGLPVSGSITLRSGSDVFSPGSSVIISTGGNLNFDRGSFAITAPVTTVDGGSINLVATPVPPAVLLLSSGLVAMGFARRRRKA
jgi:hypothetical protein